MKRLLIITKLEFNMRIALTHPASCTRPARLSFWNAFALWRSRRDLAALDAAQLSDVGIAAGDARREAQRPVWDAPASWKC